MLPGKGGANVRKTALYAGKYRDPLHFSSALDQYLRVLEGTNAPG